MKLIEKPVQKLKIELDLSTFNLAIELFGNMSLDDARMVIPKLKAEDWHRAIEEFYTDANLILKQLDK